MHERHSHRITKGNRKPKESLEFDAVFRGTLKGPLALYSTVCAEAGQQRQQPEQAACLCTGTGDHSLQTTKAGGSAGSAGQHQVRMGSRLALWFLPKES